MALQQRKGIFQNYHHEASRIGIQTSFGSLGSSWGNTNDQINDDSELVEILKIENQSLKDENKSLCDKKINFEKYIMLCLVFIIGLIFLGKCIMLLVGIANAFLYSKFSKVQDLYNNF